MHSLGAMPPYFMQAKSFYENKIFFQYKNFFLHVRLQKKKKPVSILRKNKKTLFLSII